METTTLFDAPGVDDPMIVRLVERPMSHREHVAVQVAHDGRVRLETKVLEASLPPPSIFRGYPNPDPEVARTVWQDGVMRTFDAGGALLGEEDQDAPWAADLAELADELVGDPNFPAGEVVRGLLVGRGLGSEAEWARYLDDPGAQVIARDNGFRTATVRDVTDLGPDPLEAVILYREVNGDRIVHGVRLYRPGEPTPFSEVLLAYGNGEDTYRTLDMVQTTITVDVPGSGIVVPGPSRPAPSPSPTPTPTPRPRPTPGRPTHGDQPILLTTVSSIENYEAKIF